MHLRNLVIAIVVLSAIAFAQPINTGVPGSYQVSYASNLNIGDTYINATNSGLNGAALFYGTNGTVTGSICMNVYAFSKDEQMVACCSCPVTPNSLVALSAKNDLINNVLSQQVIPHELAIKLTATSPTAGAPVVASTCLNSSWQPITGGTLRPGLVAWATGLHANTSVAPPVYQVTETHFVEQGLTQAEADRLANLCMFINANGSGAGICNSCKQGGLGGFKK